MLTYAELVKGIVCIFIGLFLKLLEKIWNLTKYKIWAEKQTSVQ